MTRRYDSFLIRCWGGAGCTPRIRIERIQSGAWIQVAGLAEAAAWLGDRAGDQTGLLMNGSELRPAAADPPGPPPAPTSPEPLTGLSHPDPADEGGAVLWPPPARAEEWAGEHPPATR